jgi:hypothetical protein
LELVAEALRYVAAVIHMSSILASIMEMLVKMIGLLLIQAFLKELALVLGLSSS